jgi:5-methylcytosine-specific restriction endonuclease McrA
MCLKFPKKKPFKSKASLASYRIGKDTCELCGFFIGEQGQVHHIVFRSQGGGDEHSNLSYLCVYCHIPKAHSKDAAEVREILLERKTNGN